MVISSRALRRMNWGEGTSRVEEAKNVICSGRGAAVRQLGCAEGRGTCGQHWRLREERGRAGLATRRREPRVVAVGRGKNGIEGCG